MRPRRILTALAAAVISAAPAEGCGREPRPGPEAVLAAYDPAGRYARVEVAYPLDETLFPPEIPAPTFLWAQTVPPAAGWVVGFTFSDGGDPFAFDAHHTRWTPPEDAWEDIKRRSMNAEARAVVLGLDASWRIAAAGSVRFSTSRDEVGAPLFYREVNLPFVEAVKDPSKIRWRFGPVSSKSPPPVVLDNLPVCGNCHSFSADGRILGMDIDYANDKGSYAIVNVAPRIVLDRDSIITWSDFRRDEGDPTFGLLSQVSPDGRYVASTVKDRSVFVPKPGLDFSQLFFPVKGILACYDRLSGAFRSIPGADDPRYVNSNPSWSPDGRYIAFTRAPAYQLRVPRGKILLGEDECREFLAEGREFRYDIYRVPFNGGEGGQAVPLPGASANGASNYFPRYSPDGKWIVFCKARSYSLLQPDSELYIMPAGGGEPRRMRCNTPRMNSWHSWSPNGRWLVFSSKANGPYTQLFLTHVDEEGRDTPPVLLDRLTSPDRAANIPEFVNAPAGAISAIVERFVDDESFVRAAQEFFLGGDLERAAGAYRKAISINPRNQRAHANLGAVLESMGKPEESERHYRTALEISPDDAEVHYRMAALRRRLGDAEDAIRHYQEAIRLNREDARAHNNLGQIFMERGELGRAEDHLEKAARLDPRHAQARNNLGTLRMAQGRPREAEACYREAVTIDPGYAGAHSNLGAALQRLGRYEEAERQYREALRLDPGLENARRNLDALMRRRAVPRGTRPPD